MRILNNKIQLSGIETKRGIRLPETVEINLGNIQFHFINDTLSKISNGTLKTSMNLIYDNGDGTYTDNLPLIESVRFDYLPTKKYSKRDLLNINGVFYNIKEK